MKRLIEIAKLIVTTFVVGALALYLLQNKHFTCQALDAFYGESTIGSFFSTLVYFAVAVIIWLIGLIIFYLKKKKINVFLYFSILTIVALHLFIIKAISRQPETHREIKEAICNKGSDDGMLCEFDNLAYDEYNYINSIASWLPEIPKKADSINIFYFRDDFLGDYDLKINFSMALGNEPDSLQYHEWKKSDGKYYYEKRAN